MAVEAEFVSRFHKDKFMIRGMGIVTFHALTFGDHFVGAPGFLGDHGLVAAIADLIGIGSQQLSMRGRVRIMTSCAFSRFDGRVHKRDLEFLLKTVMTIQAQRSLCAGLQFEFVLAIRRRET
jgi:3-hydroxymyristoyl/3-hydroxydecanoyl-(acyl carrier protein) dehydratase